MSTHLIIVSFLYTVFSIGAIIVEIRNIGRIRKIAIISLCRLMFAVILGLIPALLCYGQVIDPRTRSVIDFSDKAIWTFYIQFLLTVISYLTMNFGYMVKQKVPKVHEKLGAEKVVLASLVYLFISAVALYLWGSAFGGLDRLLEQAEWIRAGVILPTNSFAFFKHFAPLALLTSFLLFNVLLHKQVRGFKKLVTYIMLAVSVGLSSIYLQASDGRLMFASYILIFFLVYFAYQYEEKKMPLGKMAIRMIPILIIVTIVLFNAGTILRSLRGTESLGEKSNGRTIWDTIYGEFFFIVAGQQGAIEGAVSGETKLMIVNDIVNGLFAWLPTSLTPFKLESVWTYNTRLITPGATGTNPTSLVAQSVYDLGMIGVLVIPALFGALIRKTERILDSFPDSTFAKTVYMVLGFYLCRAIAYFSLYSIMIETFFIFLGIAIYAVLMRIRTSR